MKKQIAIILSLILLFCALACGASSGVPSGMDKRTYEHGKNALEIVQNYNKGLISKDVAVERLNSIENILGKLEITDSSEKITNSRVRHSIWKLWFGIKFDEDTSETIEKLNELGIK